MLPENVKTRPGMVKAIGTKDGLQDGEFTAVVSVFGNIDSYGDVVMPGAFSDSLKEWEASGDPIPVYWSHRMDDPDYNIGEVIEAAETEKGLEVRVKMDLDGPKAQQVYRLLKGRRVTQFSFAYDVLEAGYAKHAASDDDVYELRKLKIYEVGPTPIGANQETELIAVKAAGARARHLTARLKADHGVDPAAVNASELQSTRDELAAAAKHLTEFLALNGVEDAPGDDRRNVAATVREPAMDEDPAPGKSIDPTRETAASALAYLSLLTVTE